MRLRLAHKVHARNIWQALLAVLLLLCFKLLDGAVQEWVLLGGVLLVQGQVQHLRKHQLPHWTVPQRLVQRHHQRLQVQHVRQLELPHWTIPQRLMQRDHQRLPLQQQCLHDGRRELHHGRLFVRDRLAHKVHAQNN